MNKFAILLAISCLVNLTLGTPTLQSYWEKLDSENEKRGRFERKYENLQDLVKPFDRLPANLVPTRYILELQPILYDYDGMVRFTCPGKITIHATLNEDTPTNEIWLHSKEITINEDSVTVTQGGNPIPVQDHEYETEPAQEFYKIILGESITPGDVVIYIEFTAKVFAPEERMNGLYYTYYRDDNNQTFYLMGTQFEATYARLAFPHFDEPAMKAIFETSLIRHESQISLSNQNIIEQHPVPELPGWVRDIYNPTLVMSSYLNAFAVCNYEMREAAEELYRLPVKVWGPKVLLDNFGAADYSPDYSAKVMKYFEDHFGITYDFDKMDKISLPHFSAGAMENWGLNTYREQRILWIEGESTWQDRVQMSNTISHEIIHQWTGNLVTMDWWSDIWLNEGFANFYAPYGVHAAHPEYYDLESMVTKSVQVAMQSDVLPTTRPIHHPAETPQEISNMFDRIAYQKGGAILRMVQKFVGGEQNFTSNIISYLNTFSYKNAHQNDLFTHLEENMPDDMPPMKDVMESWTLQSGFPVIFVNRVLETITITQEKYLSDELIKWYVPIWFRTPELLDNHVWHSPQATIIEIPNVPTWIIINPQQVGYYRVKYGRPSLNFIIAQLNLDHTVFEPTTRSGLIDDNFNLAFNGYWEDEGVNAAFDLTQYMNNELDILPWTSLFTNLAHTHRMLLRKSAFYHFRAYLLSKITGPLTTLGFDFQDGDEEVVANRILLRTLLNDWACNLGQSACINNAKTKFKAWMENPEQPSLVFPDLQPSIYCHAVSNGGDAEWNFAWERYQNFDRLMLPETMHINLIRALGCTNRAYQINSFLSMTIELNSGIRDQHRLTALLAISGNSAGTTLAFNFIRNNYATIVNRFGAKFFVDVVASLSNHLNNPLEKQELENFIEGKEELNEFSSQLDGHLNNIQKNIDWMEDNYSQMTDWLVIANNNNN